MRWQYRTIVFEFQKDGLLGDRFIDDEDVEKTLNEQGREGWELVSATMIQDGLLTLLKRSVEEQHKTVELQIPPAVANSSSPGRAGAEKQQEETDIGRIQEQERDHIKSLQEQRLRTVREEQKRLFGEIRIR